MRKLRHTRIADRFFSLIFGIWPYNLSEVHLEASPTYTMETFCENS